MNTKFTLILSFVLFYGSTFGQNHDKINVRKLERQGYDYLAKDRYDKAKPIYEQLLKIDSLNDAYNFNMGFCEFQTQQDKNFAVKYFSKVLDNYQETQKTTNYTKTACYLLTKCYEKLYLFEEAENTLKLLEKINSDTEINTVIKQELDTIQSAVKLFNEPVPFITTRLAVINSGFDDHTPIASYSDDILYFTSKRPGGIGDIKTKDGKLAEDIWVYSKEKGIYQKPTNIGLPINTKFNDATCGLSHDGKTLFIYRSSKNKEGDIFESHFVDSVWTAPVKMPKPINSKFEEKHAALSGNGKTIYFTSNRRGGKGRRDIWISKLKDDGTWGKPSNFALNTSNDEESPFLLPDDKTLYFSSKGYLGMGGYDIFKTTMQEDGTWSQPINVGFPVNTVDDDVFYFPIIGGKKAYYTQKNNESTDIYTAFLFDEEENSILVTGIVKDNLSHYQNIEIAKKSGDTIYYSGGKIIKRKPYFIALPDSVQRYFIAAGDSLKSEHYYVPKNSEILPSDVSSNKFSDLFRTNSNKGDYSFVLPTGKDYKVVYDAPNCIFDTKNIKSKNSKKSQNIIYNPILVRIEQGKTKKSKCTPFDNNSSALNDFTKRELDLTADCLKKYPELFVNLSSEDYMLASDALSSQRKQAAIEYLKQKDIPENKIYIDLSPDAITGDSLQYTIYDAITLEKAKEDKENRKRITPPPSEIWVTITFKHFLFGFNQSKVVDLNNQGLDSLVLFLNQHADTKIEIIGYADAVGREEYNVALSEKRAHTLKTYLVKKGVNPAQISVAGFGEENPIALNLRKDGSWFKEAQVYNRRAEFRVIQQGDMKLRFNFLNNIPELYRESTYQSEYRK